MRPLYLLCHGGSGTYTLHGGIPLQIYDTLRECQELVGLYGTGAIRLTILKPGGCLTATLVSRLDLAEVIK